MAFIQPFSYRKSYTTPTATSAKPESRQDPFQTTQQNIRETLNKSFDKFYGPLPTIIPPLTRPFQSETPNFILHPTKTPQAVIHFLGAAFFGAAPHILYHTFLTELSNRGYVIVATPYDLSFEYLPLTERICAAWECVESDLASRYGPLPVIGLGHSAGALFHTLSSCLFEDLSPRSGLALISFNNRLASDAIPAYQSIVSPISKVLTTLRNGVPRDVDNFLSSIPTQLDDLVSGPLAPDRFVSQVLPTLKETRRCFEQVPPLVEEIGGEGLKQFYPSPDDVQKAIMSIYPVEQTLVIKFGGDTLDDSELLAQSIRRSGHDVSLVELRGSHVTPLAQQSLFGELHHLVKVVDEWIQSGIANNRL